MLKTYGPRSLKCQGGIISITYSVSFCTLALLCFGRLEKVINTFDLFYVNIWLEINDIFAWSKISRPLLNFVPCFYFSIWYSDTLRLRCQISTSSLHHPCLGGSLCLAHTHRNTQYLQTESPPGTVNNFKRPGKQTDKSTPLTWKHDNFPLRTSQKNKILRER